MTVDVLGLATIAVGMWLLVRALGGGTPAAATGTVLAVAGGGFGWLWQHGPAAVLNMSAGDLGRYHGDLVLSNALVPGMGNLPPLVPRDLGVCMAPLVLWAFVRALDARSRNGLVAAGVGGGLAFLCAPLAGVFLALWAAALALRARATVAAWAAAAGALVAGIWLAPLALTYHRFGGFADITSLPPANPTVGTGGRRARRRRFHWESPASSWRGRTVPGTDFPPPIRGGSRSSLRSPRPHALSAS